MTTEAGIAVLTAFIGGGGISALTSYLSNRRKDSALNELSAKQQPIDQYVKIVESLDKRLDVTEREHKEEIAVIVQKLEKCQDGHLECERKQGRLEGKIEILTTLVMQKSEAPVVSIQGAGDLRTVETKSATATSELATFDAVDSSKGASNG